MAASTEQHEKNKHGVEKHFAQHLAANEVRTRDRAVKKVAKWMKARSAKGTGFDKEELLKLWKGLYYCMWMSDKMLVQEDLADSLAEMVHNMVTPKQSLLFYQTFLITIGREWHGIDYLRVDKFYMLFRRVFQQTLMVLQKNSWDPRLVKSFLRILSRLVFRSNQDAYPSGLRLFLTDIYIEELSRASSEELTSEYVLWFLEPLVRLASETKEFTLTDSIMTVVFEEIVNQAWLGKEGDEEEEKEFEFLEEANKKVKVEGVKAFEELPMLEFDHEAISAMLLKYASKPEILSRNRKRIYKTIVLYRNLLQGIHPSQLLKPLQRDRVDRFMKVDNPERAEMMIRAKKKSKERLKLFLKRRKERKLQRQGALKGQRTSGGEGLDSGGEGAMSSSGEMEPELLHPVENGTSGEGMESGGLDTTGVVRDSPTKGKSGSRGQSEKGVSMKKTKKKKSPKGRKVINEGQNENGLEGGNERVKLNDGGQDKEGGKASPSSKKKSSSGDSEQGEAEELLEKRNFQQLSKKGDSLAKVLFQDETENVEAEDASKKNGELMSPRKSKRRSRKPQQVAAAREGDGEEENVRSVTDTGEKSEQIRRVRGAEKVEEAEARNRDDGPEERGAKMKTMDVLESEGGEGGAVVPEVASVEGKAEREGVRGSTSPEGEAVDIPGGKEVGVTEAGSSAEKKTAKRGQRKRKSTAKPTEGRPEGSPGRADDEAGKSPSAGAAEAAGQTVTESTSGAKTPKQGRKNRKSSAGTSKKEKEGKSEQPEDLYSPPVTRKRVKIALAHNEELPSADYRKRVRASPGIPFDGEKKPQSPAIKPTDPTPVRRSTRKRQKSRKST